MAYPEGTGPSGWTSGVGAWTPAQWAEFEKTYGPEATADYRNLTSLPTPEEQYPWLRVPYGPTTYGPMALAKLREKVRQEEALEAERKRTRMQEAENAYSRFEKIKVRMPEDRLSYVPGVPLAAIPGGMETSINYFHPTEAYKYGFRELPTPEDIAVWEKHNRLQSIENAGMSGVLGGLGKTARFASDASKAIAGIAEKLPEVVGPNKWGTSVSQRLISHATGKIAGALEEGAEAKEEIGGKGLVGQVARGTSEMMSMLPMFKVLGKFALPIFEGVNAWAKSNPDTMVEVPGIGPVRGRVLPTIIGAGHGAVLHSLLKAAEIQPGLRGRLVGGAVFSLPEVMANVMVGNGISPKEVAAAFTQGAMMTHGIPGLRKALEMASTPVSGARMGTGDLEAGLFEKMLSQERENQPGTLEWSRKHGTTRMAIDQTIGTLEKKIAENDPRVPVGGPQGGIARKPTKDRMFQERLDEEGYPIRMGTGGREFRSWFREKRGTIDFAKDYAGSQQSASLLDSAIRDIAGGPIPTEGSIIRRNADLYKIAVDPDKMCPRSQRQRNTQAIIEHAWGRKMSPDEVATVRMFMKDAGEPVACPQCYTESHRIQGYSAAALSPLGGYDTGDLQKSFKSPSGQKDLAWIKAHTGLRSFANTDYKPQFIPSLMKIYTDAADMGLHGNTYTKQFDYVDVFAPSKIKINISLGADVIDGKLVENLDIGVPWDPAKSRRDKFDNVGTVLVAKSNSEIDLALDHPLIDHILGMHHSSIPKNVRDRWGALDDYTSVQSDVWKPGISSRAKESGKRVYEDLCREVGITPEYKGATDIPVITDWMHNGDKATFLELCEKIGLKPRFSGRGTPGQPGYSPDWSQHENYMKLVGPECGKFGDNTRVPIEPRFDVDAAARSIEDWGKRGGLDLESGYSTAAVKFFTRNRNAPVSELGKAPAALFAGTGGKDLEAILKAMGPQAESAYAAGSREERQAIRSAVGAMEKVREARVEAEKAPKPVGETLRGTEEILPYKTTTVRDLPSKGVKYTGDVGPQQKALDAYDEAHGVLSGIGVDPKSIPDRPIGWAEIAPEADVVKKIANLPDTRRQYIETGLRFFERAGGGKFNVLEDVFYRPAKRAAKVIHDRITQQADTLKMVLDSVGMKLKNMDDSVGIGILLTDRQHMGRAALKKMGLLQGESDDAPPLVPTSGQARVIQHIDSILLKAFHEINRARISSGLKPIEWREDYFTFAHLVDFMNNRGLNIVRMPGEKIEELRAQMADADKHAMTSEESAKRQHTVFTRFPFQRRTNKLGNLDLDAFGVFGRYMRSAYEQIYLAEAQSVMDKLVNGSWKITDDAGKVRTYSMEDRQPLLHRELRDYMGFLAAGVSPGNMDPSTVRALSTLSRNVAMGKVGFNVKSMMNQLTSNVHSWSELGSKYWGKGFADYSLGLIEGLQTGGQGERYRKAKVAGDLATRRREAAFEEWTSKRPRTKFGKAYQALGEAGTWGLQTLDMVTAEITWRGAYAKGMDLYKNPTKAADYANDTVARTQGSTQRADLTRLQRTPVGRSIATLQNFVLNEWGFITRDVMGYKNVERSPENIYKVLRFVAGAAFMQWLYEDVMKVRSPFNVPLNLLGAARRGKEAYDKGKGLPGAALETALFEAETLPIVGRGFTPYGGGGGLGAGLENVMKSGQVLRKPTAPALIDWGGSLLGIPGALEASRALKIWKQGGTVPEALIGGNLKQPKAKKSPGLRFDPNTGTITRKSGGIKFNKETGEFE